MDGQTDGKGTRARLSAGASAAALEPLRATLSCLSGFRLALAFHRDPQGTPSTAHTCQSRTPARDRYDRLSPASTLRLTSPHCHDPTSHDLISGVVAGSLARSPLDAMVGPTGPAMLLGKARLT